MGPRQCTAAGMCSTKTLQWGLGSCLQWVLALPKPCGGAEIVFVCVCMCEGLVLDWGLGPL